MIEIEKENQILQPAFTVCPKCNSKNMRVEDSVMYSETFVNGKLYSRHVDFYSKLAAIGPKVTVCVDCDYEEEEDVE